MEDHDYCLPASSSFIMPGSEFYAEQRHSSHKSPAASPFTPGSAASPPLSARGPPLALQYPRVAWEASPPELPSSSQPSQRLQATAVQPPLLLHRNVVPPRPPPQEDGLSPVQDQQQQQHSPLLLQPPPSSSPVVPRGVPELVGYSADADPRFVHDAAAQHEDLASALDKCRAVISQLERVNNELRGRVTSLQTELQEAERRSLVAAERERELKEAAEQAEARLHQREQTLQLVQRHADASSSELRSCLLELKQEKERVAMGKDEVASMQGQVDELKKELMMAAKRAEQVGEGERRQQAELQQLRKEHHAVQDALKRCRIDLEEARERYARSKDDAGKQQQQAAKATAEGSGAVAQLYALRSNVADLEARNAVLLSELVAAREVSRAAGGSSAAVYKLHHAPALPPSQAPAPPPGLRPHAQGLLQQYEEREGHGPAPPHEVSSPLEPVPMAYPSGGYGRRDSLVPAAAPPLGDYSRRDSLASAAAPSGGYGRRESLAPAAPPSGTAAGKPGRRQESLKSLLYNGGNARGVGGGDPLAAPLFSPAHSPSWERRPAAGYEQRQDYAARSLYPDVQPSQDQQQRLQGGGVARQLRDDDYGAYTAEPGDGGLRRDSGWQPSLDAAPAWAPAYGAAAGGGGWPDASGSGSSPPDVAAGRGQVRDVDAGRGGGHREADGGGYYGAAARRPANGKGDQLKSIEARLQELQAAEDAIKARLAAQDEDQQQLLGRGKGKGPDLEGGPNRTSPGGGSRQQQHAAAEPTDQNAPFGTDRNAKEMLARSKHVEDSLIALCREKSLLDSELNKMPTGSGRSLRERRRKSEVQARLEELGREISSSRMQLRKLTGMWYSGK